MSGDIKTRIGSISFGPSTTATGSATLHSSLTATRSIPGMFSARVTDPEWGSQVILFGRVEPLEALKGTLEGSGTVTMSSHTRVRLYITKLETSEGTLTFPRACNAGPISLSGSVSLPESELSSEVPNGGVFAMTGPTEVPSVSCPGQPLLATILSAGLTGNATGEVSLKVSSHEGLSNGSSWWRPS
jgi:hypothetical protein